MNGRGNQDGVTLVELLVVLMLMGIMIGIVAPLLRPARFQMDAGLVVVASTLTAQQRNSVMRQHDIVLAFDSANGDIRVHYDLDNDGALDLAEQRNVVELEEGVVFGRGGTPARPLGSDMVSMTEVQDGMPALKFRRNGSASEESIIYITSERASTTAGSTYFEDARAIEIERATGRVRCYSYNSGSWLQTC
jgi:prepilin-type N-terminal cleavage/methylation domain-containing protein